MGMQTSRANRNNPPEEAEPLLSRSAEQEQRPVQCVDDPEPLHGLVIDSQEEFIVPLQPPSKKEPQKDDGK